MFNHTQGPWGRRPNDPHIYSTNGQKIAKVLVQGSQKGRPDYAQIHLAKENGDLIASAPALLAACRAILEPGATLETARAAVRAAFDSKNSPAGEEENPFLREG